MSLDQLVAYISEPAHIISRTNWVVIGWFLLLSLLVGLLCFFTYLLLRLLFFVKQIQTPFSLLEIKPPATSQQAAITTQQLNNLIHGLILPKGFINRKLQIAQSVSLEIIATKSDGIRYLLRLPADHAETIRRNLLAYLPGLQINLTSDFIQLLNQHTLITELGLSRHFAYPLKSHLGLEKLDPMTYITGNMTSLQKGEMAVYQLVVSPVSKRRKSQIKRISRLIYGRKDIVDSLSTRQINILVSQIARIALQLIMLPIGLMIFVASSGQEGPLLSVSQSNTKNKTNNPYQQELEGLIKDKLDQPLFTASIRIMIIASDKRQAKKRLNGLISAIDSVSQSQYQSLRPVLNSGFSVVKAIKRMMFVHRIVYPLSLTLLSTSEVGDIYHFPFSKTNNSEDVQTEHSKELPAPTSLKASSLLDVTFAKNTYGGVITPIGLTLEERRRHMYILGATGTGKSTMLLSMINSDIQNGKGVAVVDPHGDLIEEILTLIPDDRIKDVVYFNPDDIGYPMGVNVLELSQGLSAEDQLREKEFITESIISLFHKIYSERYSGPRMEYILRNTIHTAFTVPNTTLFTVYKLLINTKFRKSIVRQLTDENLKDFWKYEFSKAGDYQKVSMISPITNKIGRFLFSPTAKRILEQEKSTIDFSQIMDEGKILLCNLSKGRIGEDNSKVFGVMMITKLELAALKRARQPMSQRKDFYLYVDEFQNFATPAFAQILSEARKYRLNAVLAHQTMSQIEDASLVQVTLANTGTVICFRTANPRDEQQILPQFAPFVEKGELASLPSYRFYIRLSAIKPEEPFSGITMPLGSNDNPELVTQVIHSSRKLYARKYEEKPVTATKAYVRPVNKPVSNKTRAAALP